MMEISRNPKIIRSKEGKVFHTFARCLRGGGEGGGGSGGRKEKKMMTNFPFLENTYGQKKMIYIHTFALQAKSLVNNRTWLAHTLPLSLNPLQWHGTSVSFHKIC